MQYSDHLSTSNLNQMFLATTANQNFWKTDERILFLGELCRLYSQKHVWSELGYEVLPYYGLNRAGLYQDYRYSMKLYESAY
jgi:hypothetical protein